MKLIKYSRNITKFEKTVKVRMLGLKEQQEADDSL